MSYSYDQRHKAIKRAKKLNPVVDEIVNTEVVEKLKKEIPELKTFKVTFTENTKKPVTRTVFIQTTDKPNAENITHQRFGSFVYKCLLGFPKVKWPSVPSNKITISSCYLVDSDGNIIPDVVDELVVVENTTTEKPKRSRKKKSDDLSNQSLATSEAITI